MLRPAGYFAAFPCPFDGAAGGGCRRPHCQYRHRASRRAEPWLCAEGLSDSSTTKQDENAKREQCKPTEAFQCENQERNSNMSPFRSMFTKRSRSYSPEEPEVKHEDSDDECDLVIDVPPLVNKKPKISKECKNLKRKEQLDHGICSESLHGRAIANVSGCTAEKSEKMASLQGNSKFLHETEKLGNVSPKASEVYLPGVSTDILKILEQRDALAYVAEKHKPSAAYIETNVQKENLKRVNAESNVLVQALVQEHATNEDFVGSKRVTQSVLCTSHSPEDETAVERPFKQIILKTEKSAEENEGNENPEYTYPYSTDSINMGKEACSGTVLLNENRGKNSSVKNAGTIKNEREMILISFDNEMKSSGEDTELSESDDPVEECRRIFDEFERETQKKNSAKQTSRENVALHLRETKVNVAGQKRRIAHMAKFDVHDKNKMVSFKGSPQQQHPNAGVQKTQGEAMKSTTFTATDSVQKKSTSELSATQVQSVASIAILNFLEVLPVETSSGQLHILFGRNAENVFERPTLTPHKNSTQKTPSILKSGSKVPQETRQRYVTFFFEEYLKSCSTMNEAIGKAQREEQSIYNRCGNKNMYLNFAVKTLKKLRDHGQLSDVKSPRGAGSVKSDKEKELTDDVLYELLKNYVLTEEQLSENNFPRPDPERSGSAVFNRTTKKAVSDNFKRVCCRCGEIFTITSTGQHRRKEECVYHSGTVLEQKVPGGFEKRYSCCEGIVGSAGCQIAKLHVHDQRSKKMEGFMKTLTKPPPSDGNCGVYALACEMCYTTRGMELSRVTVVNAKLQVVYHTFVKPDGEVVDYNIRFSGVTEDDLKNTTTTLRDVQAVLLNLFSADTVLIGHSLENDFFALKMIHDTVVDTSVIFPHRLGLPHKRALRNLIADYLKRIHQDDVGCHNSSEDASACMELLLWKVKEDNKWSK